jgi:hypothetical protein
VPLDFPCFITNITNFSSSSAPPFSSPLLCSALVLSSSRSSLVCRNTKVSALCFALVPLLVQVLAGVQTLEAFAGFEGCCFSLLATYLPHIHISSLPCRDRSHGGIGQSPGSRLRCYLQRSAVPAELPCPQSPRLHPPVGKRPQEYIITASFWA